MADSELCRHKIMQNMRHKSKKCFMSKTISNLPEYWQHKFQAVPLGKFTITEGGKKWNNQK